MTWTREVYVATTLNGVYYTDSFTSPHDPTQPVWAALNDGLANTLVKIFALDPFNRAGRQYCLLTDGTLYRRAGGAWESILTFAQARTACGIDTGKPTAFCCDTNADGVVYVLHTGGLLDADPYVLKSTDYGATWTGAKCYTSNGAQTRDVGGMRAHDPYVWLGWNGRVVARGVLIYSTDGGTSWTYWNLGSSSWEPYICGMPVGQPNVCYLRNFPTSSYSIYRYEAGVGGVDLRSWPYIHRPDCIWFSPSDPLHMRIVFMDVTTQRVSTTTDGWVTIDANPMVGFGGTAGSLIGADPRNDDALLVGMSVYGNAGYGQTPHAIHAYDAADGTVAGKAGTSPLDPPYADSIPAVSGAVAWDGVQPVFGAPGQWKVYSCRYQEAS